MDERVKFIARVLDGEPLARLCPEWVHYVCTFVIFCFFVSRARLKTLTQYQSHEMVGAQGLEPWTR